MNTEPRSVDEYHVGGSLPPDSSTYVTRQADIDLYQGVKAGRFCYVLNSRQMGKSSLRVRTMQWLQAEGVACGVVDLTAIGGKQITTDQWYAGIIYTLASSFNLLDQFDIGTWWCERTILSPVQRLHEFIREVLLELISQPIAIFVDEIDSVLALSFAVDDFFCLISSCYNNRVYQRKYRRLTWILLGVSTPYNLTHSTKYSTLFNRGYAIELTGFKTHEIQPLLSGLVGKFHNPNAVILEVLNWTDGQPFLTQKLCKLVLQESREFFNIAKSNIQNPQSLIAKWLEEVVESRVIENWEAQDEPEHLKTIRNRLCRGASLSLRFSSGVRDALQMSDQLLHNGRHKIKLLGLYQQILQEGEIEANDSPEQMDLRLSGLVVKQNNKLKVYNRIYELVFNLAWVEEALIKLHSYAKKLED